MPLASTRSSPLPDLATATVAGGADGVADWVPAAGSAFTLLFAVLPALLFALSLLLPHAPSMSTSANPEARIIFLFIRLSSLRCRVPRLTTGGADAKFM